nr:uncharacterized protein LOC109147873 [Ipomoea batatas]
MFCVAGVYSSHDGTDLMSLIGKMLHDCIEWCRHMNVGSVYFESEDWRGVSWSGDNYPDIRIHTIKCAERVNCVVRGLVNSCTGVNVMFLRKEGLPQGLGRFLALEGEAIVRFSASRMVRDDSEEDKLTLVGRFCQERRPLDCFGSGEGRFGVSFFQLNGESKGESREGGFGRVLEIAKGLLLGGLRLEQSDGDGGSRKDVDAGVQSDGDGGSRKDVDPGQRFGPPGCGLGGQHLGPSDAELAQMAVEIILAAAMDHIEKIAENVMQEGDGGPDQAELSSPSISFSVWAKDMKEK